MASAKLQLVIEIPHLDSTVSQSGEYILRYILFQYIIFEHQEFFARGGHSGSIEYEEHTGSNQDEYKRWSQSICEEITDREYSEEYNRDYTYYA